LTFPFFIKIFIFNILTEMNFIGQYYDYNPQYNVIYCILIKLKNYIVARSGPKSVTPKYSFKKIRKFINLYKNCWVIIS